MVIHSFNNTNRHATQQWLLVSDLDGSLLDHHTYSFAPAQPLLTLLAQQQVDVALCTSKTRAEVEHLRQQLGNHAPFIVENGAAVYLPKAQFSHCPEGAKDSGDCWCYEFCQPRQHWLQLVEELKQHTDAEFTHFAVMGVARVAESTGLDLKDAERACQREFGEPLLWQDSDEKLQQVVEWFEQRGATILSGGRFVHVCGDADKGQALQWLAKQYEAKADSESCENKMVTMALGDSGNDVAMLEAADYAVVIRSPVKPPPQLERTSGAYVTEQCGPGGWDEGARYWFELQRDQVASPLK